MFTCMANKLELGKKLSLATIALAAVWLVAISFLDLAPSRAQSQPISPAHPATKFVLGDLKIDGDVHNRDEARDRILNEWKGREYEDLKDLTDDLMEAGVRKDFQDRGYFKVVVRDPVSQPLGVSDGKQRILIITSITEGGQFRLGSLNIQNVVPGRELTIPATTLREQFYLRDGDLFKVSEVRAGLERVTQLYNAKGYEEVKEVPETAIDDAHHFIAMTLRITEGFHTKTPAMKIWFS